MTDSTTNGTPAPGASESVHEETARQAYEQAASLQDIPLPKVTFTTFAMSIGSSALVQLGEVPDPETGRTVTDLRLAKHSIDVLTMLYEKTKGNLDEAEDRLLNEILYEVRMKFVIKAK